MLPLNSFAVSATSGFEFHLPAFEGQIFCNELSDTIIERPRLEPVQPEPILPELNQRLFNQNLFEPEPQPMPARPPMKEGIISGCIWGCECHKSHGWKVEL